MSETKPLRKLGLNQVFPSPTDVDGTAKKTNSVVAIHGLDTRSPTTWIAWKENGRPESGDVHWLKDEDMLPRVLPNSRIFTYDWNANIDHDAATQSLLGHADKLLNKLRIERAKDSKNRPIIFIASCFGGLLLAKALLLASEAFGDYQEIYQSTTGAVFLGTPFQGTNQGFCTAAHLRVAVAVSSGSETTKELLTYLRNEPNERGELDQLVERFCVMINHEQFIIPVVCFYETQETDFTKVIKDLPPEFVKGLGGHTAGILVPKSSACLQGKERHELSVRHSMLSKFARPDEDSFETVCYNLKDFVTKAEKRLRDRS
ncbi:hypothetical protein EDB81DRAFT_671605 [Dactylonectria macrodidyma]|uniref:Uncharacterized protein n=1 Tax=Dactylonectria macrodidyma TaxID=307937 RepID=A0A9P9D2C5_9HYPO|nr:hypothetical protein EDB81DRAFT_671605 [Dactylonectria macrodidyma]